TPGGALDARQDRAPARVRRPGDDPPRRAAPPLALAVAAAAVLDRDPAVADHARRAGAVARRRLRVHRRDAQVGAAVRTYCWTCRNVPCLLVVKMSTLPSPVRSRATKLQPTPLAAWIWCCTKLAVPPARRSSNQEITAGSVVPGSGFVEGWA